MTAIRYLASGGSVPRYDDSERCCYYVPGRGRCPNKATYERGAMGYCRKHTIVQLRRIEERLEREVPGYAFYMRNRHLLEEAS